MGEVQRVLYVQSGVPPAENEDGSLPNRHDSLCMFRICWDCCVVRYVCCIVAYDLTNSDRC
jgi:hypothetical protein